MGSIKDDIIYRLECNATGQRKKELEKLGHEKRWKAYIVNYADDLSGEQKTKLIDHGQSPNNAETGTGPM
jgi:hypothetical protein